MITGTKRSSGPRFNMMVEVLVVFGVNALERR